MMQVTRQALVQLRNFCPVVESAGVAAQRCYHKNVSDCSTLYELLNGVGRRSRYLAGEFRGVRVPSKLLEISAWISGPNRRDMHYLAGSGPL